MWLPKKLKVLSHWVIVFFPHKFKEDPKLLGLCDPDKNRIFVGNTSNSGELLDDSSMWVVFWHELFHKIDRGSGHRVFEGGEKNDNNDEGAIEAFSEIFHQVLVDNFKLREAIYKGIK